MPWRIFVEELDALAHATQDAEARGLPRPPDGDLGRPYPFGWTLRWDVPRKHPLHDEWAYNADGSPLECPADAYEVDVLGEDWKP